MIKLFHAYSLRTELNHQEGDTLSKIAHAQVDDAGLASILADASAWNRNWSRCPLLQTGLFAPCSARNLSN